MALRPQRYPLLLCALALGPACSGTSQKPTGVDRNQDNVADDLGDLVDKNSDGVPDGIDINNDGTIDGIGLDTNHDGKADALALDTDCDGIFDSIDTSG